MSFWELLGALLRRWPVLLIGALCVAAAGYGILSDKGVYFTRTLMIFYAPVSTAYPNAIRTTSDDVIDMAGVVAKRLTGPADVPKFASPDVTLVGLGVRDGWTLRLPDTGGQWGANFATQQLVLDVVAPTRAQVTQQQKKVIRDVQSELHRLQAAKGVVPDNEITAVAAPQTTIVYQVGGSRPRALGMAAALGIGGTVGVVLLLENRSRRRKTLPLTGSSSAPAVALSGAR